MAKRNWLDFAHALDVEREAIQDKLPHGVTCSLTCASYDFSRGADFSVSLNLDERKLHAYGGGRTPAKAFEAAAADLKKQIEKQQSTPRLVETKPLSLPAARTKPLFS